MLPAIIPDALAEGPRGTKLIQGVICYTLHSAQEGEKEPVYEPSTTIRERVIRLHSIYHYRRNGTGG